MPAIVPDATTEATREVFHEGWFFPGDLATVNEAGYVFLKGRRKDVIIRGGINIYPVEIEAALQSHPAVVEAAVVGWPSRDMGEEVAAFVVLRAPIEAETLRQVCAARLAPYKVPKGIFVVADMPKNASGKIVKATLAATLAGL